MADQTGGLPLDAFNKSTPSGWRPGLSHYPFRRYKERLQLWRLQTELSDAQQGPAVAGRLQGRPFNIALALRIVTQQGGILTGAQALAFGGQDETLVGMQVIAAVPPGVHQLLHKPKEQYEDDSQQTSTQALDLFFDHRRGRLSLMEYLAEHEYTYDEAEYLGGLQLNDVGKSHFLLKHSGLEKTKIDHVLFLVHNDLAKYQEINSTSSEWPRRKCHLSSRARKATMPPRTP